MEDQEAGNRRAGRVRGLRAAILPDLVDGGIDDIERERRWDQLARLYLAQQLSLYPAGYLEGSPSTERVLETVERLEEDLTDVATVHRPLSATITVGEPLEVTKGHRSPADLMKDARFRIASMLGTQTEAALSLRGKGSKFDGRCFSIGTSARPWRAGDRDSRRVRGGRVGLWFWTQR